MWVHLKWGCMIVFSRCFTLMQKFVHRHLQNFVRGAQRLFAVKHPFAADTTEANIYCLDYSFTWGRLTIFRWLFHSCAIFEAYLNKFASICWSLIFHIPLLSRLIRLFSIKKIGNLKFWIQKCDGERNMKNLTIIILQIASKICIGNSMICSDIWHKYHEWYFDIVICNFTSR